MSQTKHPTPPAQQSAAHHPPTKHSSGQDSIAQMCFSKAWGGLEMSTVKMTRLFSEHGYNSYCITYPNSPIASALHSAQLKSLTIEAKDYFSPKTSLQLRRWILEHNIKAIYLHSLRDLWLITPALVGLPEVKLFGFARMFIKGVKKKDWLHNWIYSRLNALIALSEAQKVHLLDCLPLAPEKYIVIPNGVDTQRFQPNRTPFAHFSTTGQATIGYIGRLDRQKGCIEFIEAAARIHSKFPKVQFLMVGSETIGIDSPIEHEVKKLIEKSNLGENLKLTPFRKDVEVLMNTLDVFCMPSYEENFANVLLEAMSCGLPCIATNSGGSPEMLSHGEAGLLIEPRSSQSLYEGLMQLLNAPVSAQHLAKKARTRALDTYDINHVFNQIRSLAIQTH